MTKWREYFTRNAADRPVIGWDTGIKVEPHLRSPLIHSLQRFQVGEQGDGKHLIAAAREAGDMEYAASVELFIKEEQHHAKMLAAMVEGMGGTLLKWHWSDLCFVALRRLLGLRLELLVLLTAEIIAKRYYRLLYEGTQDGVLRNAFSMICHDELGHIAFHCDYLQHAFKSVSPLSRLSIWWLWCAFFTVVCHVVAHDHKGVLAACGVSQDEFRRDCGIIFNETATSIFYPALATGKVAAA